MTLEQEYNLYARIYAETTDKEYARMIGKKATNFFETFGHTNTFQIAPYWKFEDSYEITIEFAIKKLSRESINIIKSKFPKPTYDEVEGFIWNKEGDSEFLDQTIYWCMVGVIGEVDLDDPGF